MAKTPYHDLSTQDILSAHISGLQHDIGKLQEVLDLQTAEVSGHELEPVNDQQDPALRYRIYEGSIRGWLENPSPVIYRNGSQVDSNEYQIQEAYGVIVFAEQQNANDSITADFSHVVGESNTINDINSNIETNTNDINNLKNNSDIQMPGTRMILASGMYASHNRDGYAELSSNTAMASNLADAFPFPVGQTMRLDYMACRVDIAAGSIGAMAIYKDNGEGYPGQLVVDAGTFDASTTGWKYNSIDVTLEPGLYWLVRNQDGSSAYGGFWYEDVIPIGMKIDSIPTKSEIEEDRGSVTRDAGFYGGYRGSTSIGLSGGFPDTFPSGLEPFSRSAYGSVFVRKA